MPLCRARLCGVIMRVLCDVDGVVADFVGGVNRAARGLGSTRSDWTEWDIWANFEPHLKPMIEAAICSPGFAWYLDPFDGAIQAARVIASRHELVFVTSPYDRSPTWVYDRNRWLRKYFADLPAIFTHHKELVAGDVLIEDNADNAEKWRKAQGGATCLIRHTYNRGTYGSLRDVANQLCGSRLDH